MLLNPEYVSISPFSLLWFLSVLASFAVSLFQDRTKWLESEYPLLSDLAIIRDFVNTRYTQKRERHIDV
jgi:hypothetical protein